MDFPQDVTARELADEYLFGPAILVCPVTQPKATRAPSICPPARPGPTSGTGQAFQGGRSISAAAPIETQPLYVRAGSIAPLGPFLQYTAEKPDYLGRGGAHSHHQPTSGEHLTR